MIEASCHCGAVRIEIGEAPETVNDCSCSICRRYGTLWAYYSPRTVQVSPASGATDGYMWGERRIEFHRCKRCGCVTHWAPAQEGLDRMGVNARLLPPEVLAAARRLVDGR